MSTKTFRAVRTEITDVVSNPPEGSRIWELALFIPGELTYAASLTPSTCTLPFWFCVEYDDGRKADQELLDYHSQLVSELDDQFSYSEPLLNWEDNPCVSEPIEIHTDGLEDEGALWDAAVAEALSGGLLFPAEGTVMIDKKFYGIPKIQFLLGLGLIVGERDPHRNKEFPGKFMVATEDAKGFCIVGDDFWELVDEAESYFRDMDQNDRSTSHKIKEAEESICKAVLDLNKSLAGEGMKVATVYVSVRQDKSLDGQPLTYGSDAEITIERVEK